MALSFAQSAQNSASTTTVEDTPSVMTLSEDYSVASYMEDWNWTPDGKYLHYIDYFTIQPFIVL